MLVWKALVLTQKNTKLTQSVNRSPLGQKIPDLLLEQLKATKPETKKHPSAKDGDHKPVHDDPVIIQKEHCVRGKTLGKLEHF